MSEAAVGGLPAPHIEIDAPIIIHQNRRIKHEPVLRPGTVDPAVRETHVAQIRIFSCRGIAHGDRSDGGIGNRIIQIIAPIRPADYVRRVIGLPVPVPRGLLFSVNDPLVAPVAEIVFRGRPGHIVVGAVVLAPEAVMAAEDIQPAVKKPGLRIRDILPSGEIRVIALVFQTGNPPFSLSFQYGRITNEG